MDCLDRTNVVQSVLSRNVLHRQLQSLDLEGDVDIAEDPFATFSGALEEIFRTSWADNADVMSHLYTGTPALKTDFTRTGKRTWRGAVADGQNSVTRYFINNFTDGYYCDCLDFLTLRLTTESPFKERSALLGPLTKQLLFNIVGVVIVHLTL